MWRMDHQRFLIAVHCDITVWYMTLVMGLNRSIYPFTPERPRDLSALIPEPAPSGVFILNCAPQNTLFKKLVKTKCPLRVHPLRQRFSNWGLRRLAWGSAKKSGIQRFCVLLLST